MTDLRANSGPAWARALARLLDGLIWGMAGLLLLYLLAGRLPVPRVNGLDFPCLGLGVGLVLRLAMARRVPLASSSWHRLVLRLRELAKPLPLAWGLGLLYALVASLVAVSRLHTLEMTEDLALFTQALWTTLRGEMLFTSLRQMSHWGEHFNPILLLVLPVFVLVPRPETLLAIQALAAGLGAPAIYLFTRRRLPPEKARWALLPSLLYLGNPGLWGMVMFDFHPIALATGLWLWFLALRETRPGLAWLMAGLALACGEEAWVMAAGYGLYCLLARRGWREGLVFLLLGVGGFLLAVKVVVPAFNVHGHVFAPAGRFDDLGDGLGSILLNLLGNPKLVWQILTMEGKPEYLARTFFNAAFLPLLAPAAALLYLPVLAGVLVSSYPPQWTFHQHYAAAIIPGLFIAAALGLARLLSRPWADRLRPAWAFTAVLLICFTLLDASPLGEVWRWLGRPAAPHRAVMAELPPEASVAASKRLLPLIATRWGLFDASLLPADTPYVLLCAEPRPYPFTPQGVRDLERELTETRGYLVAARNGPCVLLRHPEPREMQKRGRALTQYRRYP